MDVPVIVAAQFVALGCAISEARRRSAELVDKENKFLWYVDQCDGLRDWC